MKYLAVLCSLACALPAAAAKPPALPQVADLRQVLEQYQPQSSVPAPRQLSAQEREELRRLLRQQAAPAPRKNPLPGS